MQSQKEDSELHSSHGAQFVKLWSQVCLYIHKYKPGCKTKVIPSTDEKYISLTVGVPVRTYQDKTGMTKTIFELLHFIDSYRFMAFSLEKLAGFLPQEKFKILDRCYSDYSTEDINIIHQKGFYPYSYFDNFDKFLETKLPPRNQWKDSLRNGESWWHKRNGSMPITFSKHLDASTWETIMTCISKQTHFCWHVFLKSSEASVTRLIDWTVHTILLAPICQVMHFWNIVKPTLSCWQIEST